MRKFNSETGLLSQRLKRGVSLVACALFVAATASAGYAQAGRRVAQPKREPPVQQSPVAPPVAPVKEKTPDGPKTSLLIVNNISPSLNLSIRAEEIVQGAVTRRLSDSKSLSVKGGDRMSRGEAIKSAKKELEGRYIVWLEFQSAGFDFDPTTARRLEDYQLRYIVLEPVTGKTKAQGDVYLRSTGSRTLGGVGVGRRLPSCYPQAVNSLDFALTEAAIEVGTRIIGSFDLLPPPLCS